MRVTIAYTAKISEVPTEIKYLIKKMSSNISSCKFLLDSLETREGVSDVCLSDMESLQEELESSISTLEDLKGIARGYLSAISSNTIEGENHDNLNGSSQDLDTPEGFDSKGRGAAE